MPQQPPLACQSHDHQSCIDAAILAAGRICRERSVRLTPLRQQVLTLIWQSHKPLGAYAIMDMLAAATTRRIAPPTVYRALEFLLEHKLIHRINSLNAYIGCPEPENQHHSYFLICSDCGIATECPAKYLAPAIAKTAASTGFDIDDQSVEIIGRCPSCRETVNA